MSQLQCHEYFVITIECDCDNIQWLHLSFVDWAPCNILYSNSILESCLYVIFSQCTFCFLPCLFSIYNIWIISLLFECLVNLCTWFFVYSLFTVRGLLQVFVIKVPKKSKDGVNHINNPFLKINNRFFLLLLYWFSLWITIQRTQHPQKRVVRKERRYLFDKHINYFHSDDFLYFRFS